MDTQPAPSPAPADVLDLLDADRIAAGLAEYLEHVDPPLFAELMDNRLSWMLTGFDALGVATVQIVRKSTGEHAATAKAHWSSIVRAGC